MFTAAMVTLMIAAAAMVQSRVRKGRHASSAAAEAPPAPAPAPSLVQPEGAAIERALTPSLPAARESASSSLPASGAPPARNLPSVEQRTSMEMNAKPEREVPTDAIPALSMALPQAIESPANVVEVAGVEPLAKPSPRVQPTPTQPPRTTALRSPHVSAMRIDAPRNETAPAHASIVEVLPPSLPLAHAIIRDPRSERKTMSRIVKSGLIQTSLACDTSESLETIRSAQIERTLQYIDQAGREGVQILCMQEIFTGPYFCAEQNTRWYDSVEKIPDGPTTRLMQEYAKKYKMVIVVPLYEEESTGVYYNTAAVIDADGTYLGKYRKNHIPHVAPGFWEKFYFRPGNLGYPVFETAYAKVGVYICYDRHFPEGARELGLNGAEIVMNPSATVAGLSEYLWKLEQPAHAVANGYFVGAINRVGMEAPWNIGEFYGQSYFCDPRGQMLAMGKRDESALITAELDMDKIREVRNTWQFFRDRRPETYGGIVKL